MWTDDEDLDERRGDWKRRRVAWWHKLSDASEEFAVCIFKVEGNPEGQQVPVHSKILRTFCHILRQWSNKKSTEIHTLQHSVNVYSDTLQHTSTDTLTYFLILFRLLVFPSKFFLSSSAFTLSSFSYSSCYFPSSCFLFIFFSFFFGYMFKSN